eukprot:3368835-Prymnesium_polylepis.1
MMRPGAVTDATRAPARVCPTSAPLNPAPRPALRQIDCMYRRPAPHPPTALRPSDPTTARATLSFPSAPMLTPSHDAAWPW